MRLNMTASRCQTVDRPAAFEQTEHHVRPVGALAGGLSEACWRAGSSAQTRRLQERPSAAKCNSAKSRRRKSHPQLATMLQK